VVVVVVVAVLRSTTRPSARCGRARRASAMRSPSHSVSPSCRRRRRMRRQGWCNTTPPMARLAVAAVTHSAGAWSTPWRTCSTRQAWHHGWYCCYSAAAAAAAPAAVPPSSTVAKCAASVVVLLSRHNHCAECAHVGTGHVAPRTWRWWCAAVDGRQRSRLLVGTALAGSRCMGLGVAVGGRVSTAATATRRRRSPLTCAVRCRHVASKGGSRGGH